MPDEDDAGKPWHQVIPPRYVATVLIAVVAGLGGKGLHDVNERVDDAEDAAGHYVTAPVFRAVVDSLNRRDAKQAERIRRLELAVRRGGKRPLSATEAAEVEAILIGPPVPPKRTGRLLKSLLRWLPGM